ncbi:MAG TPA: CPCC family cysteine-rich protein [Gemmataceae bacterium]|nr:CPCC family cysteine-rich protein [Gemmataceae bacterium]
MAKKKRRPEPVWYTPADPTPRHQCPCCDFVTLPERGNYLICPVCFWEDDGQDVDALDEPSGPNHGITLRQGRDNFKQYGACEETMVEHVLLAEQRVRFEHRPRDIS